VNPLHDGIGSGELYGIPCVPGGGVVADTDEKGKRGVRGRGSDARLADHAIQMFDEAEFAQIAQFHWGHYSRYRGRTDLRCVWLAARPCCRVLLRLTRWPETRRY
ncbi:hypothetical protein ACFLX9_04185, partial [Chloroflexota bacterium]